jgi:hypothetical protein
LRIRCRTWVLRLSSPGWIFHTPDTASSRFDREIKKIVKSRPTEHGLPFSTWSLAKLADFLVAEGGSTTSATRAFASRSARRASRFNA